MRVAHPRRRSYVVHAWSLHEAMLLPRLQPYDVRLIEQPVLDRYRAQHPRSL